jgi:hypothetical protein
MFGLNAHKDEENLVAGAGFAPGCPARRPSGHARQLLLHCSTSCIHAVVRMSKIAPGDFVNLDTVPFRRTNS